MLGENKQANLRRPQKTWELGHNYVVDNALSETCSFQMVLVKVSMQKLT